MDVDFQTSGGNPNVDRSGFTPVIAAGFQNAVTKVNREVVDASLSANFDTSFGMWNASYNTSFYLNYDAEESYGTGDLYDATGGLGFPEWRSNLLLNWEMGDFFTSLNIDYIGKNKSRISGVEWDKWTTANLAVGYTISDYGTFTLGANNILNEDPILGAVTGAPVDEYMYSQTGRVTYLRYSIEF